MSHLLDKFIEPQMMPQRMVGLVMHLDMTYQGHPMPQSKLQEVVNQLAKFFRSSLRSTNKKILAMDKLQEIGLLMVGQHYKPQINLLDM